MNLSRRCGKTFIYLFIMTEYRDNIEKKSWSFATTLIQHTTGKIGMFLLCLA